MELRQHQSFPFDLCTRGIEAWTEGRVEGGLHNVAIQWDFLIYTTDGGDYKVKPWLDLGHFQVTAKDA